MFIGSRHAYKCWQTAFKHLSFCLCFNSTVHVLYMQLKCNINHIQTSLPCWKDQLCWSIAWIVFWKLGWRMGCYCCTSVGLLTRSMMLHVFFCFIYTFISISFQECQGETNISISYISHTYIYILKSPLNYLSVFKIIYKHKPTYLKCLSFSFS